MRITHTHTQKKTEDEMKRLVETDQTGPEAAGKMGPMESSPSMDVTASLSNLLVRSQYKHTDCPALYWTFHLLAADSRKLWGNLTA